MTRRDDSPFWRHVRTMDVPESLRRKMAAFGRAGHLHPLPRDLFADPSWLQVMVGQGLVPRQHHPLADQLTDAECEFFLQHVHRHLAGIAASLPSHGDYVARYCSRTTPAG